MRSFLHVVFPVLVGFVGGCVSNGPADNEYSDLDAVRPPLPGEIIGSLTYGQTSAPVNYSYPPAYRVFQFVGAVGERPEITTTSSKALVLWITDSNAKTLESRSAQSTLTM
ncbi:MAG: hypothetical protein KBF88_11790, partial [Polyangiaceae bacterium]|nr:hypothetical protein [Polyangiaceae bacterium]